MNRIIIVVVVLVLLLEIPLIKKWIKSKTRNQKILDDIDKLEENEKNERQ